MLPSTWHYEAIDSLSLRPSIRIRLAASQPWSSSHNGNGAGRYEQVLLEVDVRRYEARMLRASYSGLRRETSKDTSYLVPSTVSQVLRTPYSTRYYSTVQVDTDPWLAQAGNKAPAPAHARSLGWPLHGPRFGLSNGSLLAFPLQLAAVLPISAASHPSGLWKCLPHPT